MTEEIIMLKIDGRTLLILYFCLPVAEGRCKYCKHMQCDEDDKCLKGCIKGFAGQTCSYKCSSNCVDSLCDLDVDTGAYPCTEGCTPGYFGSMCNTPCISTDVKGKCDRDTGTIPVHGGNGHNHISPSTSNDVDRIINYLIGVIVLLIIISVGLFVLVWQIYRYLTGSQRIRMLEGQEVTIVHGKVPEREGLRKR